MSLFVVNARLDIQKLFKNLVFSLGTGVIASIITSNAPQAYSSLDKPSFAPPALIFPVVWTILYIAIGIAAYIVEINAAKTYSINGKALLKMYYFHLFLNFMWPVIFFTFESSMIALVDIILLNIFILLLTIGFAKISKSTLIFMVPYFLWCLFAMALNIALLNT